MTPHTRLAALAILLAIIAGIVLLERDGCSDCSMRSDGETMEEGR